RAGRKAPATRACRSGFHRSKSATGAPHVKPVRTHKGTVHDDRQALPLVHSRRAHVHRMDRARVSCTGGSGLLDVGGLAARCERRPSFQLRSSPMKVLLFVCVLAVIPAAAGAAQAKSRAAAAAPTGAGRTVKAARTIEITGGDTLKYDLASIQAHPGERLHVVLKSNGTAPKIVMGHNFALLKAGVKPEDFVNAAMNARATDFIPPDMQDKVIAAKGLVGPGETVDV